MTKQKRKKKIKKLLDISYACESKAQKLDIYLPDDKADAVFLYFHGGGLKHGDKEDAQIFAKHLTDRSIALISANYRMYPDNRYPDFIFDAASAVSFALNYISEKLNGQKLYVGGSSAGAYLSMMLCFDKRYLSKVGCDNSQIAGYFHDAGQPTAHFTVLKNHGIDPLRVIVDETSALYYVGLEEKYPPMRFIVSDNDIKNRYEQTMLMLSALSSFGYDGIDHVVMHGTHCEYCNKISEDGESILGTLIYDFLIHLR